MRRRVVVLLGVSLCSLLTSTGAAFAVDLAGTPGNDRLEGTSGSDTLHGLAGDDELIGSGGSDKLSGGDGRDAVLGGGEEFVLEGKSDLSGGRGGDFVGGTVGADTLSGGAGSDYLYAGPLNEGARDVDSVNAGGGDDAVFARNAPAGRDTVKCGPGHDLVLVDRKDVTTGCEEEFTSVGKFLGAVPESYFAPLHDN